LSLTVQAILELAPDPSSAKSGRDLSRPTKWTLLGNDSRSVWGLCPGSGKEPYQARVDLSGPAFKCSCPSRKFPCKHGLGLLLAWVESPESFIQGEAPGWVSEWLTGRDQREERKATPKPETPPDPAQQEKRQEARGRKIDAGLADLSVRLEDLVGQGLGWAREQPASWWDAMAARLVDAQAPGLAREVRQLRDLTHCGPDWAERMAAQLGRIHLLTQAAARRAGLTESVRAGIEARLGVPLREADVAGQGTPCSGTWFVCGRLVGDEDGIRWRRTWLRRTDGGEFALLLSFAGGREALDPGPATGQSLQGTVHWYPGPLPRRALLTDSVPPPSASSFPKGHSLLAQALADTAAEAALDPLQERFPWLLDEVFLDPDRKAFRVRDREGKILPLDTDPVTAWRLVAGAQGGPCALFGEWNGRRLKPLTVVLPHETVTA